LLKKYDNEEDKARFVEKYENAFAPFLKDKGFDWEVCT